MSDENMPPGSSSIRFLSGTLAGRTFPITTASVMIGREGTNDIIVPDAKVSRQHANIHWQNGSWTIENTSQKNYISVDNQRIQQGILRDNSVVNLGDGATFVFQQSSRPSGPLSPTDVAKPHPAFAQSPSDQPTPVAPRFIEGVGARPSVNIPAYSSPSGTIIAHRPTIGEPSIEVSSNIHGARQTYSLNKDVITVGREPSSDILIKEGNIVSGRHLQIIHQGNHYILVHPHPDRPSTLNGLYYQGRKIPGTESFRKILANGDIFRIGDENGTLVTLTYNDGTGAQPEEQLPPMQPIRLEGREITLGRAPDNKIVLPHPQVSAHHARLVQEGGTYRIFDLNSTNRTYVNSEKVTNSLLKLGDEIHIGPYRLVFEMNQLIQYDETNFIRVDAIGLKKTGNNNVPLLSDISLSIPPRKFVALVGGSGAGKSTLMDALNGLRPAHEGKVLYNGQDYYHNLAAFSTQLGYVPQDDIVHRDLTVERALYYAAKMRLPKDFTDAQINQRIEEVLEDVEMLPRRKLLVSKLSGGQRKRVSIALELLANPSLFFLDEPTSGLDPGLDRKMMFLLRKLADKGHTIVLVTHATNNINTCDYVCFLVKDGRLAFFGPPEEAKQFFGKTDFAEIYTSLEPTDENPNIPAEAQAHFKSSPDYMKYVYEPLQTANRSKAASNGHQPAKATKTRKHSNPIKQFMLLSMRYIELLKNDKPTLTILLLQAPVLGLLILTMVRFELGFGSNAFSPNNVVQCAPQIYTSSAVSPTNPTGALGVNTHGKSGPVDCNQVLNFLNSDPNGNGQNYVKTQRNGDVNKALQDFILPGSGAGAQTVLFILSFATVLFGTINGYREIVKEAPIYRRERTVNLGIMPYMFSKLVVLGFLSIVQSAILLLLTALIEPLHQGVFLNVNLEVMITFVLSSLGGLVIGLAISAVSSNNDSATSFIPIILLPQVIFAGVIIPLKDWPLQILAMIFPSRWAMIALSSSIGVHSETTGKDSLIGTEPSYHGTLFSVFSQTAATQRILLAWACLAVIIILLLITIGLALKAKDVRK
jgi:ABC-type multidrug transport system ATPase subunit/pSer/pThr/pTyr-binding forkhead associated (FHA) protein